MSPPALRQRRGVPIAAVGEWSASTGPWTCTRAQLADAVRAQYDPAFRLAPLKLGHTDPRLTGGLDGEPAVGRVENLRLSADGNTLLADIVGIPAWLDEILESAYPSRSVEAELDVTTAAGAHYEMRVTGLALLGVTAPAIESLADLADLYGSTSYVAARRVAASIPTLEAGMARALGQVVDPADMTVLATAAAVHHTATTDTTWDGPAAVAAMPNDQSTLTYCHAWHAADATDLKKDYKFPHHATKGGPANLAGVRAGLSRVSQADIPEGDMDGVRAHLQAHLSDAKKTTASRRVAASASLDELVQAAENWVITQPEIMAMCGADGGCACECCAGGGPVSISIDGDSGGGGGCGCCGGQDEDCDGSCCVRVTDIYTDSVVFAVWDDDGQALYRSAFTETDGVFTFQPLERVRATYEPMSPAMVAQQDDADDTTGGNSPTMASTGTPTATSIPSGADSHHEPEPLRSGRGRDVTASAHPTSGARVPISPAVAEALGLTESADDDQVLEALSRLRAPDGGTATHQQEGGPIDSPAAQTPTDQQAGAPSSERIEELVAAAAQRAADTAVRAATEPLLAQLESQSAYIAATRQREADETREQVLASAVSTGRIRPVDRQAWATRYDANPELMASVLDALAPNSAVPVRASGRADVVVDSASAEDEALYRQLFGAVEGVNG